MDLPSLKDALSLADQYGIGWLFALGEALLLVIVGRWLVIGKLVPGKSLEKAEKQRDDAIEKAISAVAALNRSSDVMEKMKPADRLNPGDQDGGG
ncbi:MULTISPECIES: hypothetical protein [Paenibacillus]|jgi:hypothetical protein|uniref:Uncharacterized protein n=1 Tax=Paenibacillus borealis TaxID=160799 RepID=A0A089LDS9_PAEBO|nr:MULTISPECIES: hypothetical protein [Paenibacillus]AIQ59671.1 hypothetical protein PBOR_23970 [Paenibacillus borealis]OMF31213.1 hypothetical protein BK132_07305 [Paenibacillus sp. FSL H8-0259]